MIYKPLILVAAVAVLGVGFTMDFKQHRTCGSDNAQLHSVLNRYGHGSNVIDLSRVLSRIAHDQCTVSGRFK